MTGGFRTSFTPMGVTFGALAMCDIVEGCVRLTHA